jgi:hypothetical protein
MTSITSVVAVTESDIKTCIRKTDTNTGIGKPKNVEKPKSISYVFNPPRRSALRRILAMSVKTFRCMHDECREDCSTNFRLKTLLNCCVEHASVDADYEFCVIFSCQFGN